MAEGSNHRIAEELSRRAILAFAAEGDPHAVHHTVQITSLGGSGTTALSDSFMEGGLDLPPGPGQWPHKHKRTPPAADAVPPGYRVVYPISDPRDAVLSVFRRGIQGGHWRALWDADETHTAPPALEDLDTFLAAGVDEFGMLEHLQGWIDHPVGYPVMFVRFDLIDTAWDEVAAFVGLPADHPPVRYRERASDWRARPAEVRDRLEAMYEPVAALIESFPATRVI